MKTQQTYKASEKTYKVSRGHEVDVLNVVRTEHGSLTYQMWIEADGKKLDYTWSTKNRLDAESKKYWGL